MSYTQIYYHIIFSSKNRQPVFDEVDRRKLYNYLWGILKSKKCYLYQMGGMEDHIHMLISLHPTASLSHLVRDLKTSSTAWIKKKRIFTNFSGWQMEYGAFTKSNIEKQQVINYIKNQKSHHKEESFLDEFKRLLHEEGIKFDEKYIS